MNMQFQSRLVKERSGVQITRDSLASSLSATATTPVLRLLVRSLMSGQSHQCQRSPTQVRRKPSLHVATWRKLIRFPSRVVMMTAAVDQWLSTTCTGHGVLVCLQPLLVLMMLASLLVPIGRRALDTQSLGPALPQCRKRSLKRASLMRLPMASLDDSSGTSCTTPQCTSLAVAQGMATLGEQFALRCLSILTSRSLLTLQRACKSWLVHP